MISQNEFWLANNFEPVEIAAFVGFLVLCLATIPIVGDIRHSRARFRRSMIERHRSNLRANSMRRGRHFSVNEHSATFVMHLGKFFRFLPDQFVNEKKKALRSAGYSEQWHFFIFCSAKFFPAFGVLAFIVLGFMVQSEKIVEMKNLFVLLAGSSICFFGTEFYVRWKRQVRLKRIERGLPDALDLLVICAEAGLSLDASLRRVAEEFVAAVPELSEELLLTSVELNFLPERRQALANLAQRVDLSTFRGVTSTLIQTEKYGTPLAHALRTLSSEFRENRLLKAEEKAARLPAILTVPMIVFILPALFIVLAAPAFIRVAEKMAH